MATPIVTDEEIENDDIFDSVTDKKTLESDVKNSFIDNKILEKTEKEIESDIPSNYLEVNLVSNGRIEGIPDKLHFRCYSANDALDLNVADEDKPKAIVKVLSRLCYEKFDISLLTVEDVLFILYRMHSVFISPIITKSIYIDDTIEDEKLLNDPKNIENGEINLNAVVYAFLGKDYDDNDLPIKIKVPFTIKDKVSGDKVSFKFNSLKDVLTADTYCRNYFRDEFIKYGAVRSALNKIRNIKDEDSQDKQLDEYLIKNEDKVNEYYEFMTDYSKMVAKVTQALTIVSYNGKPLDKLEDKWDVYTNKLSYDIWESYTSVTKEFPFGFKDEADVFIPSLNKTVHRRVGFQLDDFIHIDGHENSDRYCVEFD